MRWLVLVLYIRVVLCTVYIAVSALTAFTLACSGHLERLTRLTQSMARWDSATPNSQTPRQRTDQRQQQLPTQTPHVRHQTCSPLSAGFPPGPPAYPPPPPACAPHERPEPPCLAQFCFETSECPVGAPCATCNPPAAPRLPHALHGGAPAGGFRRQVLS